MRKRVKKAELHYRYIKIHRKNGESIFCRIVITVVPDKDGKADAFVCILRDITEIRKNLINDLKLTVVESTLRTINDIVFNYMNNTQLFRLQCEEKNILDKDSLCWSGIKIMKQH